MEPFTSRLHEAFELAGKKGIAVEINTAGLRKPVKEFYPSLDLLKAARRAGMHLTFGSDAHSPAEVGADFSLALDFARTAGYASSLIFRGGKPVEVPFD